MDYMDFTGVVISFYEGSAEALVHLLYPDKDGEDEYYHPVLRFEEIKKYYTDFDHEEIEDLWVEFYNSFIIAHAVIAQGQGTILLVWDISKDELIHISDGAFAEKSIIVYDKIYSLCDVSTYMTKAHLILMKSPLYLLDRWNEGERLDYRVEPVYDQNYSKDDYYIKVDGDEIVAGYKECFGRCKIGG